MMAASCGYTVFCILSYYLDSGIFIEKNATLFETRKLPEFENLHSLAE